MVQKSEIQGLQCEFPLLKASASMSPCFIFIVGSRWNFSQPDNKFFFLQIWKFKCIHYFNKANLSCKVAHIWLIICKKKLFYLQYIHFYILPCLFKTSRLSFTEKYRFCLKFSCNKFRDFLGVVASCIFYILINHNLRCKFFLNIFKRFFKYYTENYKMQRLLAFFTI